MFSQQAEGSGGSEGYMRFNLNSLKGFYTGDYMGFGSRN